MWSPGSGRMLQMTKAVLYGGIGYHDQFRGMAVAVLTSYHHVPMLSLRLSLVLLLFGFYNTNVLFRMAIELPRPSDAQMGALVPACSY